MFCRSVVAAAIAGTFLLCGSMAARATFLPVIDEFWVTKNGVQNMRDSFTDGVLPPSGPEDAITGTGETYLVTGLAGMILEADGKLVMDPSLGTAQLTPEGNVRFRTEARRLRTTNPASSAFLGFGDSFEVSALYDLSSLPDVNASAFGVRIEDFSGGNPNGGNDVVVLEVARGITSGTLGILFSDLDFVASNVETLDFIPLQALLDANPTAAQVQLSITKAAGTNEVGGYFTLFDAFGGVLHLQLLDNVGDDNGETLVIYEGESFTRPGFAVRTAAAIPEPGLPGILLAGLAALVLLRRR